MASVSKGGLSAENRKAPYPIGGNLKFEMFWSQKFCQRWTPSVGFVQRNMSGNKASQGDKIKSKPATKHSRGTQGYDMYACKNKCGGKTKEMDGPDRPGRESVSESSTPFCSAEK
jgi:hypothetical protein